MLNSSVVANMRDAHTFQGEFPDRSRGRQRRSVAGRTACSAVRSRGSVAPRHCSTSADGLFGLRSSKMTLMAHEGIITIEPGKRGGQPCIRGMRITVYDVLSYLASGMTEEQVLSDFPYLTHEDILACLAYAAEREHRMLVANE